MPITALIIRSALNLLKHLETEPYLLLIETDAYAPMHAINEMLKKKYTYRYTCWSYGNHIIEAATTICSEEIADAIRSWIGHRYDVIVNNGDIKLIPKNINK